VNWEIVTTPLPYKPSGTGWEPFGVVGEDVVWKRKSGPELLGAKQVCELLGVSASTLRRWQWQRKLPSPVLIGTARKWRRQELRALLEGR